MAFDTNGSEEWRSPGAAGLCGDHTDGDLDSIFSNWQYLAAVAWRGYQTLGCGTVVVNVSAELAEVSYAGGALPENYTRLVERYDPLEQLVIVVRHSTGETRGRRQATIAPASQPTRWTAAPSPPNHPQCTSPFRSTTVTPEAAPVLGS